MSNLIKIEDWGVEEGKEQCYLKMRHKDRALHQQMDQMFELTGTFAKWFADLLSRCGCLFELCSFRIHTPYLKKNCL